MPHTEMEFNDTATKKKGLSIPNWYWRTWEVLFGVVAACIPTLRPLYKWVMENLQSQSSYQWLRPSFYTRLATAGAGSGGRIFSNENRSQPSNPLPQPPKTYSGSSDCSSTPREDEFILPLQNFEGTVVRGGAQKKEGVSEVFKPGLHIHGDLSTSRPGHLKRWDSEARIGGGHGLEEVEDRI